MFAGAVLFAGEIAARIALVNTVSYSGDGGNFFAEAGLYFGGIPVTAVECALWVWMGSMALAGRGWARIASRGRRISRYRDDDVCRRTMHRCGG